MTEFVLGDRYDGVVHLLKEISVTKGKKNPTAKCGVELPPRAPDEDNDDWTAWFSLVTCGECLKRTKIRKELRLMDEESDPTYVQPEFVTGDWNDPFKVTMSAIARHGDVPFTVPYITLLQEGNDAYHALYHGGCDRRLVLPLEIDNVVSLYKWEEYLIRPGHEPWVHTVTMYDSDEEVDKEAVIEIAELVNSMRKVGSTLVHCQAGLNRSSLIVATSLLLLGGTTPEEVIELMRKERSPAVLCNPSFERFVRNFS